MELLHFVDYQGTKLSRTNVSDFAAYLQNCYFGLIIQQVRVFFFLQLTLIISTSLISNNRLSRSANLVPA